jgi:hypothetical protein
VATGTAPLAVTSTTLVSNLNADLLDGQHASAFLTSVTAHNLLSATHGDTLTDSVVAGDIIYGNSTPKWARLAKGTDGQVLTLVSGYPAWADATGGGASAFLDLSDAPADYSGSANYFVKVKNDESGLEFVASAVAAHALGSASHTDVDAASPSDDDILQFDSASGTWKNAPLPAGANHNLLSATHSDALAGSAVRGSIIVGNSTPKWAALGIGAAGYVLKSDGTDAAWATAKLDDWDTPDDNSDLNASSSKHGLCPKLSGSSSEVLTGAGTFERYGRHCWIHESFDALATGSIIGLGSYNEAGSWAWGTQGAGATAEVAVKSGTDKMLVITAPATTGSSNIVSALTTSTGFLGGFRAHWKMKLNVDSPSGIYGAVYVTNKYFEIYFRYSTTFQIAFYNGSGATKIMDASKDTWYTIDTFVSGGTTMPYCSVFIDGDYKGRYACGTPVAGTEWDSLYIESASPVAAGSNTVFEVDDLYFYSILPLWG